MLTGKRKQELILPGTIPRQPTTHNLSQIVAHPINETFDAWFWLDMFLKQFVKAKEFKPIT